MYLEGYSKAKKTADSGISHDREVCGWRQSEWKWHTMKNSTAASTSNPNTALTVRIRNHFFAEQFVFMSAR